MPNQPEKQKKKILRRCTGLLKIRHQPVLSLPADDEAETPKKKCGFLCTVCSLKVITYLNVKSPLSLYLKRFFIKEKKIIDIKKNPYILHTKKNVLWEYDYNLVEERTMCDRKSKSIEAHAQHHVIWRVIAVALAATLKKSHHSFPAEHHTAATHKHTKRHVKDTHNTLIWSVNDQFRRNFFFARKLYMHAFPLSF